MRQGDKMKLVEQFNHDINQSDETRYVRWTDYRKQVNSFLSSPLNNEKGLLDHLLVLGAGHCDDIDLLFLKSHYKHITLADIDLMSMKSGVLNQGFKESDFSLVQTDFTGFENSDFFTHMIDDVYAFDTQHDILAYLTKKFSRMEQYQFLSEFKEHFNSIIVLPIYTQLIYNQVLNATSVLKAMDYPQNLIDYTNDTALQEMVPIINRFNQNLSYLLQPKGHLFVLSDIFQSAYKEAFHNRVTSSMHSRTLMDEVYLEYLDKHGYGIGDYGLYALSEDFNFIDYQWIIWPFEEKLDMIVKIAYLTHK